MIMKDYSNSTRVIIALLHCIGLGESLELCDLGIGLTLERQ